MRKRLFLLFCLVVFLLLELLAVRTILDAQSWSLRVVAESPLSCRAVEAVTMYAFVFTVAATVAVAAVAIICLAVDLLVKWN